MTPPAQLAPEQRVKSADRVLSVLDLLANRGPLTFAEIATELALPKSSTHVLLSTMAARGYVRKGQDGLFALGLRVWEIGQSAGGVADLRTVLRPLMSELLDRTQETVQAAQLDGLDAVYIEVFESPHPMKLSSRVGSRLPAHASAVGKTLLAALDEEELRTRLDGVELVPFTERTQVDHDQLVKGLATIRARGYATDDEEFAVGLRCVAMPVRDAGGVVAAMSVSFPTPRWSKAVAATTRAALSETVAEASRQLAQGGTSPG